MPRYGRAPMASAGNVPDVTGERVLVTGANGFVGATLVRTLLDAGAEVAAIVHASTNRLEPLAADRLHVVRADLEDASAVRVAVAEARPTSAYHLAWRSEPGAYMTSVPANLASIRFSLLLVDALLDAGCERIVGAGSCAEYVLGPAVLDEGADTAVTSMYGAAKVSTSTAALAAARQVGAHLAWARIFYVHGPGEDARRAVPALIDGARTGRPPAVHKPGQRRDFLPVADVAAALVTLGAAGADGPFNVCSGVGSTLHELWAAIQALVAPDRDPLPLAAFGGEDEPPIVGDPSRLRGLGWAPAGTSDEALTATVRWWTDQPDPA